MDRKRSAWLAGGMLAIEALWRAEAKHVSPGARHLFYVVAAFTEPVKMATVQRHCMLPSNPTFRRYCNALKEPSGEKNEPLIETFRGIFGYEHFIVLSQRGQEFLRQLEGAMSASARE